MKRYKKFVFESENGMKFKAEASEGRAFELSEMPEDGIEIRSIKTELDYDVYSNLQRINAGEYAQVNSAYYDKVGKRAIIPEGWTVSGLETENTIWGKDAGLVIYYIPRDMVKQINWNDSIEVEKLRETYNQFVWVPVELLDAKATIDGENFDQKFGRIDFCSECFSKKRYHESIKAILGNQVEKVEQYGGFYFSRYHISKHATTGKPMTVKNAKPWVDISFKKASKVITTLESGKAVSGHIPFGAEFDTTCAWIIKTETKTFEEVVRDSTAWGNRENSKRFSFKNAGIQNTGSKEVYKANNIYDLAGNVMEWTQERYGEDLVTIRSGSVHYSGRKIPVATRLCEEQDKGFFDTGFRAVLYIK